MFRIAVTLLALACGFGLPTRAQSQAEQAAVRAEHLRGGIYALLGNGGNIGVSVGDDGVFLVDDQFAPVTPAIAAAVARLSDRPVRFVLNTHWHRDHTGGNENFARAGALIVAHDNVRVRMSVPQAMAFFQTSVPAAPTAALPVVTFTDAVTFHLNGDEVRVLHVPRAHTDGDAVVHYRGANVIHAGDVFFNGRYPFIDADSGGSIAGMLAAMDVVLGLADDDTIIIAGHGPVGRRAELLASREMLADTSGRVRGLMKEGRSVEEIVIAAPNADYDADWAWPVVDAESYIRMLCDLLAGE